jgi:hypothetical protein
MDIVYKFEESLKLDFDNLDSESILDTNLRGSVGETHRSASYDNVTVSFLDLESLVEDMDNARDFHQIGEWHRLVALLESPYLSTHHKSLVAWCIGTAIKNTDEFQQWIMEAPTGGELYAAQPSATPLHLLLQLLVNSTVSVDAWDSYGETVNTADPQMVARLEVDLQNKILYALSAASSNQPVIQMAMHQFRYENTSFAEELLELLEGPVLQELKTTSLERVRKIWNLVLDLIEYTLDASDFAAEHPELHHKQLALTRTVYCHPTWEHFIKDHLSMASEGTYIDPALVKHQQQLLEQECVDTAVVDGKDSDGDTSDSSGKTVDVEAEVATVMKRRKSMLSSVMRTLARIDDVHSQLCQR